MSKMRSMSQHDPWGSMYTVPEKKTKQKEAEPIDKDLKWKSLELSEKDKAFLELQDIIESALYAHGLHHKQWYLWRIAELLGYDLDIDADKGIAP